MQKSHLYESAAGQCLEKTLEQLRTKFVVNFITNAIYRRDFMKDVSKSFDGLSDLINLQRGQAEFLKNCETHFSRAVSKMQFILK